MHHKMQVHNFFVLKVNVTSTDFFKTRVSVKPFFLCLQWHKGTRRNNTFSKALLSHFQLLIEASTHKDDILSLFLHFKLFAITMSIKSKFTLQTDANHSFSIVFSRTSHLSIHQSLYSLIHTLTVILFSEQLIIIATSSAVGSFPPRLSFTNLPSSGEAVGNNFAPLMDSLDCYNLRKSDSFLIKKCSFGKIIQPSTLPF